QISNDAVNIFDKRIKSKQKRHEQITNNSKQKKQDLDTAVLEHHHALGFQSEEVKAQLHKKTIQKEIYFKTAKFVYTHTTKLLGKAKDLFNNTYFH
ncbi:unnamed protein product, partial [Rotaria sordida]